MKRRYGAILGCIVMAIVVAAPVPAEAALSGAPRRDMVVLRSGVGTGALLVSMPVERGRAALRLPLGLMDDRRRTDYAAIPRADGRTTLLQVVDVASGKVLRSMVLAGRYSTQQGDYSAAALSFNGRWLALRALSGSANDTRAIVVDTVAMRAVATLRLAGHFGLDAVDAAGRVLYLIQNLSRHGPEAYLVRSFELRSATLDLHPVFEKEHITGTMSGVAWTRAWSPDGDWLFTLYVRPGHQGAFVHALGVEYKIAQCIDLPTDHASAATLAHFTLAVSRDGTSLYAIDPLLGEVAAVRGSLPYGSSSHHKIAPVIVSPARTLNGSALSQDGTTLFVATDRGIWVVDTARLAPRAMYLPGQRVSSVALSPDGRRLYALEPGRDMVVALDPADGRVLGTVAAGAGSWAIASIVMSD